MNHWSKTGLFLAGAVVALAGGLVGCNKAPSKEGAAPATLVSAIPQRRYLYRCSKATLSVRFGSGKEGFFSPAGIALSMIHWTYRCCTAATSGLLPFGISSAGS